MLDVANRSSMNTNDTWSDAAFHCPTTKRCVIAGLRALVKKHPRAIKNLIDLENVDVLCLQETKMQDKHVADMTDALALEGWRIHWNCSTTKAGYSGVAVLYRQASFEEKPVVTRGIGVADLDCEGRVITLELPDMSVVNAYVPNAGMLSDLLVFAFRPSIDTWVRTGTSNGTPQRSHISRWCSSCSFSPHGHLKTDV
jgi:exonuclease III